MAKGVRVDSRCRQLRSKSFEHGSLQECELSDHRRARITATAVACVALGAACSGGVSVSAPVPPTTARPTTTLEFTPVPTAATSTTSSTSTTLATTTTSPADTTTTTEALGPVAQLTGELVDQQLNHAAVVIKIDNHERARPQFGLNVADVVYEEIVEGRITRFAAVFHSTQSDPVGPVRSARTSDFDILNGLNRPLFANSGGNTIVLNLLRGVNTVNANVNALPDLFYRESSRSAPHNLMTETSELLAARGSQGGAPPVLFEYRRDGDELPEVAREITGIDLQYGGLNVSYDWDEDLEGWARTQEFSPHVDSDGVRIAPPNVIIQFVAYGRSSADPASPEAILVGEGEAWILVDGHLIEGQWERASAAGVTSYTLPDGSPIKLDPGRTWIALPRIGQGTIR